MILVTGATGFVGGRILDYFCEIHGQEKVFGIGRNAIIIQEKRAAGFYLEQCNLTDLDSLEKLFSRYQFTKIIHAAAKSSPWGSYDEFHTDNVIATKNLISLIAKNKLIKLIYISTPSIYFNYSKRLNVSESTPINYSFVNDYTVTKFVAECLVRDFSLENDQFAVILRPRAILGRGDTVIIPRVLKAYELGKLRIIGKGDAIADFTSVENLCHAISLALNSTQDFRGEIFNITDGNSENLWDFIRFMLRNMKLDENLKSVPYRLAYSIAFLQENFQKLFKPTIEPALTCYGIGILNYSLTMDIAKAKEKLGYQPMKTSRESVLEYIQSVNQK